jgi:RimJ/RimL family protein N-acetyltransferase
MGALKINSCEHLGPLQGVALRTLTRADLPALFSITPPQTFRFFLAEPTDWTLRSFEAWADVYLFRADQLPMLVMDASRGALLGSSSFMDVLPQHRHVEIGCTWFAEASRGTHVNPATKLLMLEHAMTRMFADTAGEAVGCSRVTLKCDGRNEHSQRAIAKLGAVREGTLRKHRIRPDGYVRDTVYFSILSDEWSSVQRRLQDRLATLRVQP